LKPGFGCLYITDARAAGSVCNQREPCCSIATLENAMLHCGIRVLIVTR